MNKEYKSGLGMVLDHESELPFVDSLAELKRSGSNLLVTGPVQNDIHCTVCEQMLGNNSDASRCQIIVSSNPDDRSTSDEISSLISSSSPVYIMNDSSQQVEIFKISNDERELIFSSDTTDDQLTNLRDSVINIIDQLETANDGFTPAELRVCFSMHLQLFDDYETERVISVIRSLTRHIQQSNGMGHLHLSTHPEQQFRSCLTPIFNGVVELDSKDSTPRQRWHLPGSNVTSEWLPIDNSA